MAGCDGTRDPSKGPVLEHERIHPVVVDERNDGEANGQSGENHRNIGWDASLRGTVGWHEFVGATCGDETSRDSRRDAGATFLRAAFSV